MSTTPAETVDTTGLSVATEAIDFQDGSFFQELLSHLSAFPRSERTDQKHEGWTKLESAIEKSILKRTGLQINVALSQDFSAWIITPILDWSHIFQIPVVSAAGNTEELYKFFTKAEKEMSVCVDLKKSFVSGTLAKEAKGHMEIGRHLLYRATFGAELTDEEVVALMLHEIGHFFTSFEMLDRTVATNQVLAELARNLVNEKEPSKRETVIKTAAKQLNVDRNVTETLLASDDKTVTTVLFTTGMKNIRTQSGHSFYDMNTWEMMADQFAARHGANKHLFTALHKMIAWYPDMTMASRASFVYVQVATIVGGLVLATAGGIMIAASGIGWGLLAILLGLNITLQRHESINEPIYDNDFSRLKRMRNQHVQQIKLALGRNKSKFNSVFVKQLTEEVELMDKVLEQGRDQPSLMSKLAAFFSASESNRQANTAFQKELEGLAHNDLYAKALQLKTI